ncbi:MAG: hypothetical protein ACRDWW_01860 [Acidimicrobiales bacterium]
METQLPLLDYDEVDWRLDERTRELGRRGVAEARRALTEALARSVSERPAA